MDNRIKVDMVDMQEAMQDENAEFMGGGEASADAIPDMVKMTNDLCNILEYLNRPDVKAICVTNESVIRMKLINEYADSVPLKFIDLFMEKDPVHKQEHVERTMKWIETLSRVKAGEIDLEEASQGLVSEVNERYVYSQYGGKAEFEAALQEELAKGQKGVAQSRAKGF